jgi:serine/threonine-protein kinase
MDVRRLPHIWVLVCLLVVGIVVTREIAMPTADVVNMVHQIQLAIHPAPKSASGTSEPMALASASHEGPPAVFDMPNECGHQGGDAQHDLTLMGLKVRAEERHDKAEAGIVVAQSPSADARVLRGSSVVLTVSQGPGAVLVPDLKNQTQEQAQAALTALGLGTEIMRRHDMRAPPGTVLALQPATGAAMRPGSTVRVVVSVGPYTGSIVPDVMGMPYDQAMEAAGRAGMLVSVLRQTGDPDENIVKGQKPMPGTELTSPPPPLFIVLGPPAPTPSPSASPSGLAAPIRNSRGSGGAVGGGDH